MPDTREPRSVIEAAEQAAAAGDYASAERLLREAAGLQEASLGPLHPDVANTLNNLGVVCEITGKPDEAEQCFRRASRDRDRIPRAGSPLRRHESKEPGRFLCRQGNSRSTYRSRRHRASSATAVNSASRRRLCHHRRRSMSACSRTGSEPKSTDVLPKPPLVQEARPLDSGRDQPARSGWALCSPPDCS